jgi:hypothetical protein
LKRVSTLVLFANLLHPAFAQKKLLGEEWEKVYIYFGRKYFCDSTLTPWVSEQRRLQIRNHIYQLEHPTPGISKKAQPLQLWTDSTERNPVSLYDVTAKYTVLYFWRPNSKKSADELADLITAYYGLKKLGIDAQVFAASTIDSSAYDRWLEYGKMLPAEWINACDANHRSTFRFEWDLYDIQRFPMIYILDKNKIIKARRIAADQ